MAKDKCVSCGTETSYDESVHIDFRDFYVEGLGQFCRNCHSRGNAKKDSREMILIPKEFVNNYSNDFELGTKVRQFFYETYGESKDK